MDLIFGLTLAWRERAFEWLEPRRYEVVREFTSGPFLRFRGGVELIAEGKGTRVAAEAEFTPRNLLGRLLADLLILPRSRKDFAAILAELESYFKDKAPMPFPARHTRTAGDDERLRQRAAVLAQAPLRGDILSQLIEHLRSGYDDEVTRMRPFEWADRRQVPRREALRAFLHAVKAGLLDMSWEVLCPNCAAPKEKLASLTELKKGSHCDTCRISYDVDFDDSVELRFSINPAVRPAVSAAFCAGSPAHTPGALLQQPLGPGEDRELEIQLDSETYRLRCLKTQWNHLMNPAVTGGTDLSFSSEVKPSGEIIFRPGLVRLHLRNTGKSPALFRLERQSWIEQGAKASLVTTLQEFRDLFSTEVLSPDVQVSVRSVTLLFSDLKDSTALYERIGDSSAYSVVREHFDYLFEIISRHQGSVVKTIGDAVMAVFHSSSEGLAAALEIQEHIQKLNAKLAPRPPVIIKLGLHQGATVAVNNDGMLDYFGTTVNVAARVQNESRGSDIVLSASVYQDPATARALEGHRLKAQPFSIQLKGLSETFELWRLIFPS